MPLDQYHYDTYVSDISITPLGWCLIALVGVALFVLIFRPFSGSRD